MTVELAVLTPVVIVVALVAYNLMRFVGACAAFDRVARTACRLPRASRLRGTRTTSSPPTRSRM